MAIYAPGKRDRRGRIKRAGKSAVATLSLTAMVDMFTVLVVFLLMNYQSTGEVIPMKDNVDLPEARAVDDLEPANVVVLSREGIEFNNIKLESYQEVVASQDWVLKRLQAEIRKKLAQEDVAEKKSITNRLQKAIVNAKNPTDLGENKIKKITIQADKQIDILSLKKVMYTVTQAGGGAVNFAVLKIPGEENSGEADPAN